MISLFYRIRNEEQRTTHLTSWLVVLAILAFSISPQMAQGKLQQDRDQPDVSESPIAPQSGASHVTAAPVHSATSNAEKASFSIKVNDLVSPYETLGLFVMPGEQIDLETVFSRPGQSYRLSADAGAFKEVTSGRWTWTAPEQPGVYELQIDGPFERMQINAFVKTRFENGNQTLKGYTIGAYQKKPLRKNPKFNPPEGLIEVNEETAGIRVSPHFTLGAFASHQAGDPKFLLLDERLILKLEMLLEEVRKQGIEASTFTIMSAYRTPWYNQKIGNKTKYSLHLYGRAADIFIDEDKDGKMDDLNQDGKINSADAKVLYDIAEAMDQEVWYQPFIGGLGLYGPKPHRGPFVHVDVRGYAARW